MVFLKKSKTKRPMTSGSLANTNQKRMLEKIVRRRKLTKTEIKSTDLKFFENGTPLGESVLKQKIPSVNLKFSEGIFYAFEEDSVLSAVYDAGTKLPLVWNWLRILMVDFGR
jgi:hypothetical protein